MERRVKTKLLSVCGVPLRGMLFMLDVVSRANPIQYTHLTLNLVTECNLYEDATQTDPLYPLGGDIFMLVLSSLGFTWDVMVSDQQEKSEKKHLVRPHLAFHSELNI
ncbi:hypothetical protein K501DRAFT_267924 [Backusella circina FSU 941]|nr:hypothetical protein K501DRAFT_267924 [Backusella circina FSU 941]